MKLRKQAHAVYQTQYHIVWITRYRRKILVKGIETYLKIKFLEITKYYPDWDFVAIGCDKDHVHIQIIFPPKYSISKVVETIKSNTSKALKSKFSTFLKKIYWDNNGIWGTGYFVSTIGLDENIIKRYVENQGKEETGQAQPETLF
jgi:putative transposase